MKYKYETKRAISASVRRCTGSVFVNIALNAIIFAHEYQDSWNAEVKEAWEQLFIIIVAFLKIPFKEQRDSHIDGK